MRNTLRLILQVVLLFCACYLPAQSPGEHYDKSVTLFDENVRDSSLYHAREAERAYATTGYPDSALLAVIMISKNEAILNTLPVATEILNAGLEKYGKQLKERDPALLNGIFQRAHLFSSNYQHDSAIQYYEVVYDRLDWSGEPTSLHVKVLTEMGFVNMQRRDYVKSKRFASRALEASRKIYGPDAKQNAPVVHTMCMIYNHLSRYDSALIYAREMLRINLKVFPEGHANIGIAHNELGTIFQNLCRYDSAIYHRKRCEEIFYQNYLKEGQGRFLSVAYGNLGYLYWVMEEFDLALEYNLKGYALAEEQYGPNSPGLIFDLASIGSAYEGLGQPEKGLPHLRRAYWLQQIHGPTEWGSMAYCENFLANIHNQLHNYDSAKYYAQLAIEHYAKAQMSNNKISVNAISFMGRALLGQGDTIAAEPYFYDAAKRFASFDVPWHENVINMKVSCARAARYHGVDSAQALIKEAFRSASLVRSCKTEACLMDSLFISGHVLNLFLEQVQLIPLQYPDNPGEAARETDAWISRYEDVARKYLGLSRSDSGIRLVAANNQSIYDAGVLAHYAAWQQSKAQDNLNKIFEYITKGKSLTLRLSANNRDIRQFANLPESVLTEEKQLIGRVTVQKHTMLQDSSLESRKEYSDALEAYARFKEELKKSYPQYHALKYNLDVPALGEMQKALKDERYLEFAFADTATLLVLLIDRDKVEIRTFPAAVVKADAEAYRQSIVTRDDVRHREASAQLYAGLMMHILPETGKVVIGPDEDLYGLSFESVYVAAEKKYLIESYDIYYAPSTDAWLERVHKRTGRGLLDLTPGFDQRMKDDYVAMQDSISVDSTYLTLLSQPFMLSLSEALAADFQSSSYRGLEATEARYKEGAANFAMIHFGTHAMIDDDNPLRSHMVLASEPGGAEDGYLYTYEIYGTPIDANLAVLTACETGGGRFEAGQGIQSLAHAFAYAGCPSIVMSLWSIDEKTTAEITRLFYENLQAGESKSEALASAKRTWLSTAEGELRHPFYWSGLVLMGNDGEVGLESGPNWLLWAGGILLAGIALLIAGRRRRERSVG